MKGKIRRINEERERDWRTVGETGSANEQGGGRERSTSVEESWTEKDG